MNIRIIIVSIVLVLLSVTSVMSQKATTPAERALQLRMDLVEVTTKETELRVRLDQIEEALKPENIDHSLAGIGSTKPEELRDHRRRVLSLERDGLMERLKILEAARLGLQSAILTAELEPYLSNGPVSSALTTAVKKALDEALGWLMLLGKVLVMSAALLIIGAKFVIAHRYGPSRWRGSRNFASIHNRVTPNLAQHSHLTAR